MPKEESLLAAYILDGKGSAKQIGWEDIYQWTPEAGPLWIHLNYQTKKSKEWLSQYSGLDKITTKALTTENSRPRSVVTNESLLVFLRGLNLNPGQDPEDMVSIRLWMDKHRVITTRKRRLAAIDDIVQAIAKNQGPTSTTHFLMMLNDSLTNQMADVLNDIDEQVTQLEENVLTTKSHLLRPKISELRQQVISIRRYLAPQREALYRLQIEESALLTPQDRARIREAGDRVIRYIEDLDSAKDRATIFQEELSSRLAEQMNRRMYTLSLVATIFLPLMFITGLLGMNVGGIPGQRNNFSFTLVCIVLVILAALTVWVFHKKKWTP